MPENGVNEEFNRLDPENEVSYNKNQGPQGHMPWKRRSCGKQACDACHWHVSSVASFHHSRVSYPF